MLLAQDVHALCQLFFGHRARIGLQGNGIRRFVVPQLDLGLDLDRGGERERRVSFDLDAFEGGNFNQDGRDTCLTDGAIIIIRDETANDILLHGFGIALLEQGLRRFAGPEPRHPDLSVEFLIGLYETLRHLLDRHLDLESPLHWAELGHFHFHLTRDFLLGYRHNSLPTVG